MLDFHEKRKIRSLVYSKYSIFAVVLLIALLSVSTFERFSVERKMLQKREAAEAELEVLRERAAALEAKVEHLNNERGIEEEIRSRFDVAKEGEQVVIIIDGEESETSDLDVLSKPPGEARVEKRSLFEVLKFW